MVPEYVLYTGGTGFVTQITFAYREGQKKIRKKSASMLTFRKKWGIMEKTRKEEVRIMKEDGSFNPDEANVVIIVAAKDENGQWKPRLTVSRPDLVTLALTAIGAYWNDEPKEGEDHEHGA